MKFLPLPVFTLAALAAGVIAQAASAAPLNDNLAAYAELPPSGPATSGSNTGATLEAAEPLPPGYTAQTYARSVWYGLELATSEPSWYAVETAGSEFDTVLSIWSGDDYETPLSLVHVNDESAQGGVSRILFYASPSTIYKVAVAGKGASQQGNLAIRAAVNAAGPFARLSSATVTPSVDVTHAAAQVTATFEISANSEIASGSFVLLNPDNLTVASVPFSGANRIDGFIAEGTYRVTATVPQGTPAGTYRWKLQMTSSHSTPAIVSYGREALAPAPAGALQTITIQNTAAPDTYTPWAAANGLEGSRTAPQEDYDLDGLQNLAEFASGLDPQQPLHSAFLVNGNQLLQPGLPQIKVVGTGNQRRLRVEYVKRLNDSSLTYKVQFSSDLVTWADANQPTSSIAGNATHEVLAVEDAVAVPARSRRYARVQIAR
ncbi:MAG TPA: hypothetical protein VGE29_07420 [Prosthecobacter sp.]